MKKYMWKIGFYVFFLLGFCGLNSCTDYLNKAPLSTIQPDEAYKDFKNFQGFTEELYNCIPCISAHAFHNSFNFGEEALWEPDVTYPLAYSIDRGDYWAWNASYTSWFNDGGTPNSQDRGAKGHLWGLAWYAISKANLGIANLDKMNGTEEEKDLIAGQLYFFRAWFHFMLMQYWGGLPYINKVLPSNGSGQDVQLPRLSYQACADSAAKDFQKAADLLPVNWDDTKVGMSTIGNNNMRINKVMALAYLGKDLLWAGSPLMNYVSIGKKSYNTDYCKRAADAFAEALQICESTGRYQLADFSKWTDLFYTHNQNGQVPGLKEAIFMENLDESSSRWRWNMVNDFRPQLIDASGVKISPTANYVDYYGMANGLPITDPEKRDSESGYDPEYPWKNRDPRFYKDFIFDGVKCCLNGKGDMTETKQYASLYTNGDYRQGTKGSLTGYMLTKFCPPLTNDYDGYRDNNCMVLSFMRLSDVYLMYAEATAEGYGTPQSKAGTYSLSAADAINKIRDRAGVGHVAEKYLGSTDSFMSEVRRERAVELAFEGHRFVDLRRWMLLLDRPYTLKKAVYFDRAPGKFDYDNPQDAHVLNLREDILFERHYSEKHYWFPLLKNDVTMYEGFKQNPGW
jgi:hypothetical protein